MCLHNLKAERDFILLCCVAESVLVRSSSYPKIIGALESASSRLLTTYLIDKASTSFPSSFEFDVPHNEITTFLRRIPHELICSYSETQLT
jgi:hypothetical protein